jgi:hypothetical protein
MPAKCSYPGHLNPIHIFTPNFCKLHCNDIVTCRPVAGQRLGKHVHTDAYRETIGHPFLANGAVNTLTNC